MTRNYQLVYYDAENVGIIGILAYPKTINEYLKTKNPYTQQKFIA